MTMRALAIQFQLRDVASFADIAAQVAKLAIQFMMHPFAGKQVSKQQDHSPRNFAYLFFPDGTGQTQDKLHITTTEKESWNVSPGDGVAVFDAEINTDMLITTDLNLSLLDEVRKAGSVTTWRDRRTDLYPDWS